MYWSDAELGLYLVESLRTWNTFSWCFRDRGLIQTVADQAFYDPKDTLLGASSEKILDRTILDQDLAAEIQYHLLEPANDWSSSTAWSGTEMFSMADIQQALQRRKNQFLLETSQVIAESKLPVGAGVDRISLPDTTVDLRRAVWIEMNGAAESTYTNLWRTDDFQLSSFASTINLTPGVPQVYSVATMPETEIRLSPPTNAPGKLDILAISTGTPLDLTTGARLNVLNDSAHVIKWGALADLLGREGPAMDKARADYCQQRWTAGVEMAKITPTVLSGYINDRSANLGSLFDLDINNPNWQGSSGSPEVIALSGPALIGLSPRPDGIYSITLDVVRNAIVPVLDSDYLQVGREYLDSILDCAQHLAAFKMGGTEFKDSIALYQRFMKAAIRFNDRLKANASMFEAFADNMVREENQRPSVDKANAKAVPA